MFIPLLRNSCVVAVCTVMALECSSVGCIEIDPDHCSYKGGADRGHAWCQQNHPEFPLCSRCEPSSNGHDGCVSDRAPPPRRCLVGEGEPEETGAVEPPPTTSGSTGDSSGASVGCEPGYDPQGCTNPGQPICVDQQCLGCSHCGPEDPTPPCAPDGSEACVECDPSTSPPAPALGCPDGGLCDANYRCVEECTYHEQCADDEACDLVSGRCFGLEPGQTRWVDADAPCGGGEGSEASPHCSVAEAFSSLGDDGVAGEAFLVRVVARPDHTESGALEVPPGKRIMIAGDSVDERSIVTFVNLGSAQEALLVDGSDALYLRGLSLARGGLSQPPDAVRCEQGASLWLDDVEIAGFADGVDSYRCEQLLVRRSSIHDNAGLGIKSRSTDVTLEASAIVGNEAGGVDFTTNRLSLAYCTIIGNGGVAAGDETDNGSNVRCGPNTGLYVRSSIILSEGLAEGITSLDSACEAAADNVTEASIDGPVVLSSWFGPAEDGRHQVSIEGGHEHFRDKASWRLGDPLYDIDGELHVRDGDVVTYAGADEP